MLANEKMTIRVPKEFKRKVRLLARQRMLSDSDIIREAVLKQFSQLPTRKPVEQAA